MAGKLSEIKTKRKMKSPPVGGQGE